jgi:hypothetical protein
MRLAERKEILEKSGLCLFCLKHAAELECYRRGGLSKPRCTQTGCDGEHTPGVHKLMGEESAGVNLIPEDGWESEEDEDEDEEWWVGTVGVVEEAGEPEPEGGAWSTTSVLPRESGHGSGNEPECPWDGHILSGPRETGEDRWWSPEPPQPSSEEDEEEVQYLIRALGLESQGGETDRRINPAPRRTAVSPRDGIVTPGTPTKKKSRRSGGVRRGKPRKKIRRTEDQEWEQARRDAWLRELLTDTSESENEEDYKRFSESRRWMAELFRIPHHVTTTSGGECSGQKTPDSS